MQEGVPQILGDRYHVVRELGRGGMGIVYLARDVEVDMEVAVKVRGMAHVESMLWLKREFRAVASLRHPNLVELYELVAHDRTCYFTMEYLAGVDPRRFVLQAPSAPKLGDEPTRAQAIGDARTELSDPVAKIASAPSVPHVDIARVRSVLAQLAEGLAFLHARGVIHRDIKPSNAIVVDGTVKLLDFGLAAARGQQSWPPATENFFGDRRRQGDEIAREARVVGTAGYLAPEYLDKLLVSPALDIYALGVLAFELVTGAAPFGGALGFLVRRMERPPIPAPSTINSEVPPDLDALILRMLAADPAARPSALEVAQTLSGPLSTRHALQRAPRFVGRTAELGQIARVIDDPEPRGRLVLVTGPSGVGKTALIEEACRRASGDLLASRVTWRGRCYERERVPYRAFDAMIDDIATQLAGDPTLATTVEHPGALARVFPVLASVIEPVVEVADAAADLRIERERALVAMTQLFRALVPAGVIVIDDLQWADDDSLELLASLVEHVGRPLTVIASWTTDEPPRRMRELLALRCEVLDLPGMPERELAQLVSQLAPEAPVARIVEAARRAAGNPYLADLLGYDLADHSLPPPTRRAPAGTLAETFGRERVEGLGLVDDPEARRLDKLQPTEREIAELVALATGATTFRELRDLAELPANRLASALRGLEDARVLRAQPSAGGDPVYAFYHQRLRDAAHRAMTPATRNRRHAKYARWYEAAPSANPEQLAYHWEHAGEPGRAARWAEAAGDAAMAQLSWALAADWYRRALALEPVAAVHSQTDRLIRVKMTIDERPLRAKLGDALFYGGDLDSAAAEYLAVASADRDGDRWRVQAAEALLKLGELDRGLAVLDDVLERHGEKRARSRGWSVARAVVVGARWLAPAPPLLSRLRRVRSPATQVIDRDSAPPAHPVLGAAYRAIASYLSTPQPIEAFEYVMRGIAFSQRSGDTAAYAQGLAMLSAYLAAGSLGRYGERLLVRADALASGDDERIAYARMVIAGVRGITSTLRGDWAGMRAAHEMGEAICKQLGYDRSWEASFLRSYWALGELYAGDCERSLALLDELTSARAGADDLFTRALLGSYRGRALVVADKLHAAHVVAGHLERTPQSRTGVAAIYRGVFLAELALAEGDHTGALAIARETATAARAQWLSAMPAISVMIDAISATAELGLARAGDRGAATRALATAKRIHRKGRRSFYAATGLRLQAQAEQILGGNWRATLARAAAAPAGAVDRLAIAALAGSEIDPGALAPAIAWSTAGALR